MRSFPIPPAHKSDTLLWAGIRPLASFPPVFKLCKVATASSVMPKIRICFYRSWLTTMALSFECLTRQHTHWSSVAAFATCQVIPDATSSTRPCSSIPSASWIINAPLWNWQPTLSLSFPTPLKSHLLSTSFNENQFKLLVNGRHFN